MRTKSSLLRLLTLGCLLSAFSLGMFASQTGFAQDTPELTATQEDSAEDSAEPTAETDASVTDDAEPADASSESDAAANEPADEEASEPAESTESSAEETAEVEGQAEAAAAATGSSVDWLGGIVLLAVLLVPIVVGNWLGLQMKMPDHGWKMAVVLTSIAVGAYTVVTGQFKFGTDLAGGTTLVYEVKDKDKIDQGDTDPAAGPGGKVRLEQVIAALKKRIDPAGTKEVSIRKYGEDIEVIIPKADQAELAFIKKRLTDMGQLEFRITARPEWPQDRPLIEAAEELPPSQKVLEIDGEPRAQWVGIDSQEFPPGDNRIVTRQTPSRVEALVLVDALNVTGEHLSSTRSDVDETGGPAVSFNFNAKGSQRFGRLTSDNLPNSNRRRYLGIILDDTLLSAPFIRQKITSQGQISGKGMTKAEVDNVVAVLEAGSLPAALNETPISEETISATIGPITIEKGKFAIGVSLAAVLVFILLYYRTAGFIACLALVINLLLVLGFMVLFGAAFTLPGLAGLVLTVGMSVDANVLIFERIREEMNRGAALRMAIRNGFDRATTTIVDANLTTLITGIVLYAIGTDQIRGFAVTLILGILMSMYTAIFCSRLVFEIGERKRWIKSLSFSRLIGDTNWDFIGKRAAAAVFSLVVIGVGLIGVFGRGAGILDIDFTGGTSVTQVLADGVEKDIEEIRSALEETELADKNLLVNARGTDGTRYTIRSAMEEVGQVQQILADTFGDDLLKYSVAADAVEPWQEGSSDGSQVALQFNQGTAYGEEDGLAADALQARLADILEAQGHRGLAPVLENPEYLPGSNQRFKDWTLKLALPADATQQVVDALQQELGSQPIFPLANKIGGKVAGNMQTKAIQAILVSLLGIVAYLWFRFQNVAFGLAAVVALVHDVLVTLGFVAISAYVVDAVPALATALQLDSFQISLTMIAAFLTIIGYSLNDTIVIFDRIREVRGKSPHITPQMVNTSINQTLARTLLTSLTTLIVVIILYFFGGPGIHSFAFALVVGVVAGTYSTIFVACPALLAMVGSNPPASGKTKSQAADAA